MDLRIENMPVGRSDRYETRADHKSPNACDSQIHVPPERPRHIAMDPANAIAVPHFGVSGFRKMHRRLAEAVGLVRVRGVSH